jgi:hypothetical protein
MLFICICSRKEKNPRKRKKSHVSVCVYTPLSPRTCFSSASAPEKKKIPGKEKNPRKKNNKNSPEESGVHLHLLQKGENPKKRKKKPELKKLRFIH